MNQVYIYKAASVTNQKSFDAGFSNNLVAFKEQPELDLPVFKEYIKPALLRRMSKVTRMGLSASIKCLENETAIPSAIILGTALGCLEDTVKFSQNVSKYEGNGAISPTSFIQSGHNTVGGQIALYLKNNGYNMTHVQKGFSFENAIYDFVVSVECGNTGLVGTFDEKIMLINELASLYGVDNAMKEKLSEGTSVFLMGREKKPGATQIKAISTKRKVENIEQEITGFLNNNATAKEELSNVFIGQTLVSYSWENIFNQYELYTNCSGMYWTSNAFGVHIAHDFLSERNEQKALVVHLDFQNNLSLILLEHE